MRTSEHLVLATACFLASCGYDVTPRPLAYLADGSLYVAHADGGGPITIAHGVRRFRWVDDGTSLELVMPSLEADSALSTFSIYRIPLEDVWSFYRTRGAQAGDTLLMPGGGMAGTGRSGGPSYTLVSDTLTIRTGDLVTHRIPSVHAFALMPRPGD